MRLQSNEGTWFDFCPDKPGEGRICLRVIDVPALNKMHLITRTKVREFKAERKHGKLQLIESEDVNEELENKLLWDHCIVDWENLNAPDGKTIECNQDNKKMVMEKYPFFARIVAGFLEELEAQQIGAAEEVREN